MYKPKLMRVAFGSFAALCLSAAGTEAAEVNTADFIAACTSDISVTEDPGFEDGKATPKAYCECVAAEFANAQLNQADVDMLTKMHKEEITDEDVENFPTLEDLMNANEDIEDGCREKLGLPVGFTDIEEEEIDEEEMVPEDEDVSPPE